MPNEPERATWLHLPAAAELDADTQALLAKAQANVGFVPNVFAAYTIHPTISCAGSNTSTPSCAASRCSPPPNER